MQGISASRVGVNSESSVICTQKTPSQGQLEARRGGERRRGEKHALNNRDLRTNLDSLPKVSSGQGSRTRREDRLVGIRLLWVEVVPVRRRRRRVKGSIGEAADSHRGDKAKGRKGGRGEGSWERGVEKEGRRRKGRVVKVLLLPPHHHFHKAIMSAPVSNTPTADASKEASSTAPKQEEEKKELPQLGALEEDDEFEEFAQQGQCTSRAQRGPRWRKGSLSSCWSLGMSEGTLSEAVKHR